MDPLGLDVTIALYPGAFVFGHVGIGVNTLNTTGFYPVADASNSKILNGLSVSGVMQSDVQTPIKPITIPTTPEQDQAIQAAINRRVQYPGNYRLYDRNCTTTVRDALRAGGINTPQTILPGNLFYNLQQQYRSAQ
ncbi:DUF4105 domain-containing protein [Nitrosomonas sp.]|uniref:lipoprotein N-acyltransferase Lnb domain-containing protein n=1 Tax=Nitrosomonas sp. TaxID=42353 RepID=UPI0025DFFCB2